MDDKCTRIITFFRQWGGDNNYQWVEINNPFSIQDGQLEVDQSENNVPTQDTFVSSILAITSTTIGEPSSPGVVITSNTTTTLPIRSPAMYHVDHYTGFTYTSSINSTLSKIDSNTSYISAAYYAGSIMVFTLYIGSITTDIQASMTARNVFVVVQRESSDTEVTNVPIQTPAFTMHYITDISCVIHYIYLVPDTVLWQSFDWLKVYFTTNHEQPNPPYYTSITVFYTKRHGSMLSTHSDIGVDG